MNREEMVRRFEALLDASLADEEPPRGIDAELLELVENGGEADRRGDSYALWSAMTALTQEVKLQGRAFKELNEQLQAALREQEREVQREVERRSRKAILGPLLDVRDRLARGLDSAKAASAELSKAGRAGVWERLFRSAAASESALATVDAVRKGYQLSLERLDQMLEEFQAKEIRCQGEPFDPRRMNAVDLEESSAVPDGTVVEVYRSGYEWNGEVFRPAQVKVSRSPSGV